MKSLFSVLFLCALAAPAFAQGMLTPPGPPAPTMKTLDQVEPRFDLQGNIPPPGVTTDANYNFIITQPGSYYLSANLNGTKSVAAINVVAAGVTIDLNGFEIRRVSGAGPTDFGVEIGASAHRCVVKNGSIRGFDFGVAPDVPTVRGGVYRDLSATGCSVGLLSGINWIIERCNAYDNTGDGINAGAYNIVSNCTSYSNDGDGIDAGNGSSLINCIGAANSGKGILTGNGVSLSNCAASGNTGTAGIHAGDGSSLLNCTASSNTVQYAILTGNGCSLTNCTTRANTSAAADSYGIACGARCSVVDCTSTGNTNTATSLTFSGIGIFTGDGSTVRNCTVQGNKGDGIRVTSNSQVIGNTCDGNGNGVGLAPTDAANIRMLGSANRVEMNLMTNCDQGMAADADRNFIARNTARTNTSNYVIAAGNRIAQIVVPAANAAPIAGANSGSTDGFTAVDPWANFSF